MRKRLTRLDKLLVGGILLAWGLGSSTSRGNLLETLACVGMGAVLLVLAFLPRRKGAASQAREEQNVERPNTETASDSRQMEN